MITQKQLKEIIEGWGEPDYEPKYRVPLCAGCGKRVYFRIWHIFLREYGFKREVHLCKKCGKKYGL